MALSFVSYRSAFVGRSWPFKESKRGMPSFDAVPKAWREKLSSAGFEIGRAPVHTAVQAKDGTAKVNTCRKV